jgi:hypothetical protein
VLQEARAAAAQWLIDKSNKAFKDRNASEATQTAKCQATINALVCATKPHTPLL